MKKSLAPLISGFVILVIIFWVFYAMMPQSISGNESLSEFSTKRALEKVKYISQKPHYVGTINHTEVGNYLVSELQKMGLETSIQEGFSFSDWGNLTRPKNILAKIKGSNSDKALLLLAHYDSAPHSSSLGASDDGSGIATILEGVRAFLHNNTPHKNDIIILFSDAEELGLNGAALFVTQHNWAKNVGLVLNFEARGSSGPSYMLMETNVGNASLVNEFTNAKTQFPVSNSLMYSIYKMLPNDTDLTIFRNYGNIQGFNFAFIDNHFNYHSVQDNYEHVDPKTIEHQGKYLMPLLKYFGNSDIKNMNSTQDYVYFNTPFNFISYSFEMVLPMWIAAFVIFLFLLFLGLAKKVFSGAEILKGSIFFLISLTIVGLITFFGWKGFLLIYPEYDSILQGFTYNGHNYITAFYLLSLSICFFVYKKFTTVRRSMNYFITPLLIWLTINFFIVINLKGAGFFIFPVFMGLAMLAYFVITQKTNWVLNLILSLPTLIIVVPFIQMFPIGLGLKILYGIAILTVLAFGLLLPIFNSFPRKGLLSLILCIVSISFFIKAHISSDFEAGKAKPNSLLYVYDANLNKAVWATYDTNLDEWTKKYLGKNPKNADALNTNSLYSKYNSEFRFTTNAPLVNVQKPGIEFVDDSITGSQRYLKIKITPNRNVNRYDIFANENMIFNNFIANGAKALGQKGINLERKGKKILSYYVVDNIPLEMEFSIDSKSTLDMELMESSFDLMTNSLFTVAKRESWMMPMPFVLNDAVVIKQKIKPMPKIEKIIPPLIIKKPRRKIIINDTISQ
jgi:Peptidase family M28